MALNHRYLLRLVTDSALILFVVSALGMVLWVTDEFLGWNILPDWIDKYAQLILVLFGAVTGLLVGASLLCSLALLAEAAAERAGIRDFRTPARVWRVLALAVLLFGAGLFAFYRIDLYRKGVALREARKAESARYEACVREFQAMMPGLVEVFPAEFVQSMREGAMLEQNQAFVTFLGAIQSSAARHPEVTVVTRASAPYQYCRYRLLTRRDTETAGALGRYYLEKQFYTGFPSSAEAEAVAGLFGGQTVQLQDKLEGEVINNVRPGAWMVLRWQEEVAGLLVIQGDFPNRFGFFHGS